MEYTSLLELKHIDATLRRMSFEPLRLYVADQALGKSATAIIEYENNSNNTIKVKSGSVSEGACKIEFETDNANIKKALVYSLKLKEVKQ